MHEEQSTTNFSYKVDSSFLPIKLSSRMGFAIPHPFQWPYHFKCTLTWRAPPAISVPFFSRCGKNSVWMRVIFNLGYTNLFRRCWVAGTTEVILKYCYRKDIALNETSFFFGDPARFSLPGGFGFLKRPTNRRFALFDRRTERVHHFQLARHTFVRSIKGFLKMMFSFLLRIKGWPAHGLFFEQGSWPWITMGVMPEPAAMKWSVFLSWSVWRIKLPSSAATSTGRRLSSCYE